MKIHIDLDAFFHLRRATADAPSKTTLQPTSDANLTVCVSVMGLILYVGWRNGTKREAFKEL